LRMPLIVLNVKSSMKLVDAWPQGALVSDLSSMPIPLDLAPGRYTVRAILLASAHARNHRLRDFFFDDDVYNGVVVGEIVVE
jgi:hypothetical protein